MSPGLFSFKHAKIEMYGTIMFFGGGGLKPP
jgi:hypothetical protein